MTCGRCNGWGVGNVNDYSIDACPVCGTGQTMNPSDGAHDALNRMRRAHFRVTGCYLTSEMIASLATTFIGQMWEEADPRALAAGSRRAKTARQAECEASQSGPPKEGNAHD